MNGSRDRSRRAFVAVPRRANINTSYQRHDSWYKQPGCKRKIDLVSSHIDSSEVQAIRDSTIGALVIAGVGAFYVYFTLWIIVSVCSRAASRSRANPLGI